MTTKTVLVRLEAMTSQYVAKMGQATASTAALSTSVTGATAKTNAGFSSMSLGALGFGTAVALGIGKSIDAARDFEKAFTQIQALSNSSAADVERWKAQVLTLAGETARAPQELADALFFLSSAGLAAGDVMPALEAAAKGAAVGLGSTADVANIVASALNAYAKSGLTAAQVTDTLVAAVREGRAEPDQFAQAMGRILPIASAAGVSFDQVAASLAALSNIGLDVNEGVTAMRGVIQAIAAPGSIAAQTLNSLGLSAQQLLEVIQTDGLFGALQLLDQAAKDNSSSTAEYNGILRKIVPNIRSLTGVLGQTGQNAEKVAGVYDRVANSAGALDKAFAITSRGPAFQFQQMLAKLQELLIAIGEALLPLAVSVVEAFSTILGPVTAVVEAIAEMPGVVDLVTAALVALVAIKVADFFTGMAASASAAAAANVELAAAETLATKAAATRPIFLMGRAVEAAGVQAAGSAGKFASLGSSVSGFLNGLGARLLPAVALIKGAQIGMDEFAHVFTDHDLEAGIHDVTDGMRLFGLAIPDLGPTTNQAQEFKAAVDEIENSLQAGAISATDAKDRIHALADELGVDLGGGFDQAIDRMAGYTALNIVAQQQIDATNAALDAQHDAAIESGVGLDMASQRFLEFAQRLGVDGQDLLLKWRDAVSKFAEDDGKAVHDLLQSVSGDWEDFRQSVAENLNFAPDLISGLESAAQQARDTLSGDISGTSAADLAKLRSDANLTASELLGAFREAKRQTQSFAQDLLKISRTGGEAGKALAASFLEAGDVIAAQVVANAPEKMRQNIVTAFGAGQDAADNLSTKLTDAIVGPLESIRDVLFAIARRWGIDVEADTGQADAKLSALETRLLQLSQKHFSIHLGFTGVDLPPGVKHAGGIIGASGARRYHDGGLAGDEVPAILQRGERVLSRTQNAAYERMLRGSMFAAHKGERTIIIEQAPKTFAGDIHITNWRDGTGHFRGIARDEIDQDGAYGERLARMQRR